jgi:peptidoglycan hydrolase-like protein with peptidoglycan-binding domain
LQEKLISLGYELGTADGIYGKKTDAAVRSFQDRAKRMTDGICDTAMRELLGM